MNAPIAVGYSPLCLHAVFPPSPTKMRWRSTNQLVALPLQLVEIGWHLKSDGPVRDLVKKGSGSESSTRNVRTAPCSTQIRVRLSTQQAKVQPTSTTLPANCIQVAEFFKFNPHAHAAAPCTGGILWRIFIDVLPMPSEEDLLRPFHPQGCDLTMVDGQRYWSPRLTEEDKETIAGV